MRREVGYQFDKILATDEPTLDCQCGTRIGGRLGRRMGGRVGGRFGGRIEVPNRISMHVFWWSQLASATWQSSVSSSGSCFNIDFSTVLCECAFPSPFIFILASIDNFQVCNYEVIH